jgi:protoporphyrinogen IX oxidase
MTTDLLLAAHIIGLMMGAGGGFGSMIAQREALKRSADQAATLRSIGPALARFSSIGLVIMLITGPALVQLKYGGFSAMPQLFWVKMIFVTTLTIAAITMELLYAQSKAGNQAAAPRVAAFGPIAGISSILAVVFAVLAFH